MKNKYLILFACLLIGLVVLYVIQKNNSKITVVRSGIEELLPGQNLDKVSEIRIYSGGQEPGLVIKRTDNSWNIPTYFDAPANNQKIESFLKDIENLKGEKRASSKGVFQTFALDEDKAMMLELLDKNGDALVAILAGKQGPMGSGCFIRFKDKEDVYLIDKNLPASFGILGNEHKSPEPKLWADLKIMQTPKDAWSEVEIIQPEVSFTFAKQKKDGENKTEEKSPSAGSQPATAEVWVQKQPESPKLQEGQIQSSLNALTNLQAVQLVAPNQSDAYGLKSPAYQARITTNDGNALVLLFNQPDGKGPVYAKLDNKKQVFEVSEASFKAIFLNLKNQPEQKNKEQSS